MPPFLIKFFLLGDIREITLLTLSVTGLGERGCGCVGACNTPPYRNLVNISKFRRYRVLTYFTFIHVIKFSLLINSTLEEENFLTWLRG